MDPTVLDNFCLAFEKMINAQLQKPFDELDYLDLFQSGQSFVDGSWRIQNGGGALCLFNLLMAFKIIDHNILLDSLQGMELHALF